jgi:hypothetical protein
VPSNAAQMAAFRVAALCLLGGASARPRLQSDTERGKNTGESLAEAEACRTYGLLATFSAYHNAAHCLCPVGSKARCRNLFLGVWEFQCFVLFQPLRSAIAIALVWFLTTAFFGDTRSNINLEVELVALFPTVRGDGV